MNKRPRSITSITLLSSALAVAFTLGAVAFGDGAFAQKKKKSDPNQKAPGVKVERRNGKKVFRITTGFVIEGRIQKPNAFYVLQRSQINYDWAKLKKDFVPRILESVKKSPF